MAIMAQVRTRADVSLALIVSAAAGESPSVMGQRHARMRYPPGGNPMAQIGAPAARAGANLQSVRAERADAIAPILACLARAKSRASLTFDSASTEARQMSAHPLIHEAMGVETSE